MNSSKSVSKNDKQILKRSISGYLRGEESGTTSTLRARIWIFFEEPKSSMVATFYAIFMVLCILGSLISTMILSIERYELVFSILILDLSIDLLFLVEVVCRFIVCPSYKNFWFNAYNIIDFLSVTPVVVTLFVDPSILTTGKGNNDLDWLLFILVVRPTLRLLKFARHFYGFRILINALSRSMDAMPLAAFLLILVVVTGGSLLFFIEGKQNSINNVPKAAWFALVAVSTVGYGDTVPETPIGKIVCSLIIVGGILCFALPLSIVGENFSSAWSSRDRLLLIEKIRARLRSLDFSTGAEGIYQLVRITIGKSCDQSKQNCLTLELFQLLLDHMQISLPKDRAQEIFDDIDVTGEGFITSGQLSRIVYGPNCGAEALDDDSETSDVKFDTITS